MTSAGALNKRWQLVSRIGSLEAISLAWLIDSIQLGRERCFDHVNTRRAPHDQGSGKREATGPRTRPARVHELKEEELETKAQPRLSIDIVGVVGRIDLGPR
jgi:hypothetical protein